MRLALLLFSLCILIACFVFRNRQYPYERVLKSYQKNYETFQESVLTFQKKVDSGDDVQSLKESFVATRLAFKRCEWLMEYLEPGLKEMNGPDLEKVDQSQTFYATIPPYGMQVLERLLEEDTLSLEELKLHAARLLLQVNRFHTQYPLHTLRDWQVLDALRLEILRIAFMGTVSFDNPIQRNGIQESEMAWNTLKKHLLEYEIYFQKQAPEKSVQLYTFLKEEDGTFFRQPVDHFDHFRFIRDRALPLYDYLGTTYLASGLEQPIEAGQLYRAVNFEASSPFENGFLDPWFYSGQRKQSYFAPREALGKRLFYDSILSFDQSIACVSCHHPEKAFSDGMKVSRGVHGGMLSRNAPGLINAALQSAYFWDMRAEKLENQIQQVIRNPSEFNSNYQMLITRLGVDSSYLKMFEKAFPEEKSSINEVTINSALASYVRSLVAHSAEFDSLVRGEKKEVGEIVAGFNLFMGKARCGTCHFAPEFSGLVPPYYSEQESEVLGVPATADLSRPVKDLDGGRDTRENSVWYTSFKTPGLRNVNKTAPYMHNGVFANLSEVVEFYNKGGGNGIGLDIPNQTLPADTLGLTEVEKHQLVRFLKSLSTPLAY